LDEKITSFSGFESKTSVIMSHKDPGTGGDVGSLLLNQPIVIDNGTSSIKAGFAGSSKPKVSNARNTSVYRKSLVRIRFLHH
jgi:hypothetical protein